MPSPAWREAFSTMWTNTDSVAKGVVEDAIRAGKSDCANYCDDYHIVRTTADAPTIHNQNKWTLFHVAAAFNHLQCAKILLESGGKAVLRKTSHNGSTPLHLAANAGHLEMCHFLNDAGASLKVLNRGGRTPLLEAAKYKHYAVVAYLREAAEDRKKERDNQRRRDRILKSGGDPDADDLSDDESLAQSTPRIQPQEDLPPPNKAAPIGSSSSSSRRSNSGGTRFPPINQKPPPLA